MAGNSKRRGAVRKPGSKKGASGGSGGKGKDRLAGRGPTPPAEARVGHPAARRATAERRAGARSGPGARPRDRPRGRRAADNVEVVVGRNPVLEALRAQIPATALYLLTDADPDQRLTEAAKLAAGRGLPVIEVPRIELDRLTGGDRHGSVLHQGIGLQVPPFRYAHPDELLERALARSPGLIVAIDGITDPRNLGAVIRSAAGFGAQGVVVPERRAAGVTAAAWRTSAGAAARVPVARATNLVRTLTAYRKAGLIIAGLSADGGTSLDDFALASDPLCVVVGSEGRGLSRLVGETCEVQVAIPMSARLESLNASVAAAVVLAEVARRRRLPS